MSTGSSPGSDSSAWEGIGAYSNTPPATSFPSRSGWRRRKLILRSGWEWELPHYASDFRPHSIFGGCKLALRWLAEQRIPSQGLITVHRPEDTQSVYQGLLHRKAQGLFQVFDWQNQDAEKSGTANRKAEL